MKKRGNSERGSEVLAREFLESKLKIELAYNDVTGQADYFCAESGDLVEVTSYFMQDYFENNSAHMEDNLLIETATLSSNWLLLFDCYPKKKHVESEVLPHLQKLEIHHIFELNDSSHRWWMKDVSSLTATLQIFDKFELVSAKTASSDMFRDLDPDKRFVCVMPSLSYSYSGPNGAIEHLEEKLFHNSRDIEKLSAGTSIRRHYFVWINSFTHPSVKEAFLGENVKNLPSRIPQIDPILTDLWVVEEERKLGWHFNNSAGWRFVF